MRQGGGWVGQDGGWSQGAAALTLGLPPSPSPADSLKPRQSHNQYVYIRHMTYQDQRVRTEPAQTHKAQSCRADQHSMGLEMNGDSHDLLVLLDGDLGLVGAVHRGKVPAGIVAEQRVQVAVEQEVGGRAGF